MLKPFAELLKADVSKYISKKPTFKKVGDKFVPTGVELDYISWVDCLILLYENGAENVHYGNILNDKGHSLFLNEGRFPEVRVFVEIDGNRFEMTYPLIDGRKHLDIAKATQSDIHNASQRAFVKCVAVNTGLGLPLWQKEEKMQPKTIDESIHNLGIIIGRVRKLYAKAVQSVGEESMLLKNLNVNKKQIENIFSYSQQLSKLETALKELVR